MRESDLWVLRRSQRVIAGAPDSPTCRIEIILNRAPTAEWIVAFGESARGLGETIDFVGSKMVFDYPVDRLGELTSRVDEALGAGNETLVDRAERHKDAEAKQALLIQGLNERIG